MKKNAIALVMEKFGIQSVIVVSKDYMDSSIEELKSSPDYEWCGGLGKEYLHSMLSEKLKLEDAYFNEHLNEAIGTNQRWVDFCDDCAILVAADAALYGNPIVALHPDSYKENLKNWHNKDQVMSDLPIIPGFQIIQ